MTPHNIPYEKVGKNEPVSIVDEVPFEIPESWCWERWGNISESIQYGYNAPAKDQGRIKMVRISDIQDNSVIWNNVPYCDISEAEIETYLLKKNDILFARTGGTVGKSYLVSDVQEESIYAGYLIRTRYSNRLCPQYLKLFMESPLYWEQLKVGTTATAQPNCNGQTLGKMFIPIPPRNEQMRIVEKVNQLNTWIDKYRISETKLKSLTESFPACLKKSILQEAVMGKLMPQNPDDEPAAILLERIRKEKQRLIAEGKLKKDKHESIIYRRDNSHYEKIDGKEICIDDEIPFEIPDTWEWARLGTLITYQNGYAYSKSDYSKRDVGTPVIKSNNLMSLQVVINHKTNYIESPTEKMLESQIHENDLLMCLSSQSENTEPLGKTAIFRLGIPALLNQRVLKMTPYYYPVVDWMYYAINSEYFHYTVSHRSGGSAQSNLKLDHVLTMLVPMPPLSEQKRIIDAIKATNRKISAL